MDGEDCPYLQLLKQDGETVSEETVVRFLQSSKMRITLEYLYTVSSREDYSITVSTLFAEAVTAQFGICCYNSCFGAKTEIRLIFEARNSAGFVSRLWRCAVASEVDIKLFVVGK